MIQLKFICSERDIQATTEYLHEFCADKLSDQLYDHVPRAHVIFKIDTSAERFSYIARDLPVLKFAIFLNLTMHSIALTESKAFVPGTDSARINFTRPASDTILVSYFEQGQMQSVSCSLRELRAATEAFCRDLCKFIEQTFPDYFKHMDSYYQSQSADDVPPAERVRTILCLQESIDGK